MEVTKDVVQKYLDSLLQQGVSFQSQNSKTEEVEDFIYLRLTSKKFRKTKMDDDCVKRTQNAISLKTSQNQPLKVIYPQGGYKLWRFPSSPEADWAEFFNLSYLVKYLRPIVDIYEPGVELVYYMHTLLMERHDNLTTEEIQEYVDSFQRLINEFQKYLPKNFHISILRDADIYSREEYFSLLEQGKESAEGVYLEWPKDKQQDFQRMAMLNIKWDGKEDWSSLSDKKKEEKLRDAALYELAATTSLEKVMSIVKAPENILVFTKGTKDFIGIGSTRTSIAKYWVGFGVLEKNSKENLQTRILTPSQYELALKIPHQKISIDFLSDQNFTDVLVFEKPFDFRKTL